jgi:hypothetical protein
MFIVVRCSKADKTGRGWIVRFVPTTDEPQPAYSELYLLWQLRVEIAKITIVT